MPLTMSIMWPVKDSYTHSHMLVYVHVCLLFPGVNPVGDDFKHGRHSVDKQSFEYSRTCNTKKPRENSCVQLALGLPWPVVSALHRRGCQGKRTVVLWFFRSLDRVISLAFLLPLFLFLRSDRLHLHHHATRWTQHGVGIRQTLQRTV